jgi:hypothetical protein
MSAQASRLAIGPQAYHRIPVDVHAARVACFWNVSALARLCEVSTRPSACGRFIFASGMLDEGAVIQFGHGFA